MAGSMDVLRLNRTRAKITANPPRIPHSAFRIPHSAFRNNTHIRMIGMYARVNMAHPKPAIHLCPRSRQSNERVKPLHRF